MCDVRGLYWEGTRRDTEVLGPSQPHATPGHELAAAFSGTRRVASCSSPVACEQLYKCPKWTFMKAHVDQRWAGRSTAWMLLPHKGRTLEGADDAEDNECQ